MRELVCLIIWLGPAVWLRIEYDIGMFVGFLVCAVFGLVAFLIYGYWNSTAGVGFDDKDLR